MIKNKYSAVCFSLFALLITPFTFSCENIEKALEHALSIELLPTNTLISEQANIINENMFKKVKEGDYVQAIRITTEGIAAFPHNFMLQADLAGLLGDLAEIVNGPLKSRMLKKSLALFDRLLNEIEGQPKELSYSFLNEYYYRFARYREQHALGCKRVREYWGTQQRDELLKGYYSQGVGAANYAKQLLEKEDSALAREYAHKALVAWAQYFSYENSYYNAYVHHALALGILGYKDEMMRALERSASLINQNLEYAEFKEVIDFVNKATA
jgi:hypothetical protein